MKTIAIFSVLACAAGLAAAETNAARLARGLPPNPPIRRGTRSYSGQYGKPSSNPNPGGSQCNTGSMQCCNSVTHSGDKHAGLLAGALGIVLPAGGSVGLNCSPLSILGLGSSGCSSQPVCCENNDFEGLIALGCSPINIL